MLLTLQVILTLKLICRIICSDHFIAKNLAVQSVRIRGLRREHDRARCDVVEAVARSDSSKRVIDLAVA